MQDWFNANAPKPTTQAPSDDWFSANMPKPAAPKDGRLTATIAERMPPDMFQQVYGPIIDFGKGVAKGVASTAIGMGELAHRFMPGVSGVSGAPTEEEFQRASDDVRQRWAEPSNAAQRAGFVTEQIGEYFVPAVQAEKVATTVARHLPKYTRLFPNMAAQSASAAGVATAQGADPTTAAISGAVSPAVAGAAGAGLRWIGSQSEPLVRAAIKPTVTSMRRVAGAGREGLDAKAEQLVTFIIANKISTPEKATAIFNMAESELQALLKSKNAPTDAPQRMLRYLQSLERSARRQGLPAEDAAIIRNAAAELLEGPMGKDVVTMVPQAHPTLVGPNGKSLTVLVPQTSRALRTDVTPSEALDSARASGQWSTRKRWGEQKGARVEAEKTAERGQRDAVKVAVPEARGLLSTEARAIQAREVLDRMQFRARNRDAISLPAHVIAAGELAQGRVPVLAFAANWLRNNQLPAGLWADALRRGMTQQNPILVAQALERLGVAIPPTVGAR